MSILTLVAILVVPMIILGAVTLALIIVYMNKVARVTAELEARKKQVPRDQAPPPGPELSGEAEGLPAETAEELLAGMPSAEEDHGELSGRRV